MRVCNIRGEFVRRKPHGNINTRLKFVAIVAQRDQEEEEEEVTRFSQEVTQ